MGPEQSSADAALLAPSGPIALSIGRPNSFFSRLGRASNGASLSRRAAFAADSFLTSGRETASTLLASLCRFHLAACRGRFHLIVPRSPRWKRSPDRLNKKELRGPYPDPLASSGRGAATSIFNTEFGAERVPGEGLRGTLPDQNSSSDIPA